MTQHVAHRHSDDVHVLEIRIDRLQRELGECQAGWKTGTRALEDNERLRAEVARLQRHVEELQEKVTRTDCACSYDIPGDVCMTHSPTVERLRVENEQLRQMVKDAYRQGFEDCQHGYTKEYAATLEGRG